MYKRLLQVLQLRGILVFRRDFR